MDKFRIGQYRKWYGRGSTWRTHILTMKLTLALTLFLSLGVQASIFAQKVSLSKKHITLEALFKEIRKQTNYRFIFEEGLLDGTKPVSLNFKDQPLEDVLQKAMQDQNLTFQIYEGTVVVKKRQGGKRATDVGQEEVEVRGLIQDGQEPLPGVSILVKDGKNGTSSDVNGRYIIKVPKGAVLIFKMVGYREQENVVNAGGEINITMQPDNAQLSEVVVVGFGQQKKQSVVGAITTVNPEELKVPSSSLTQSFAGRLAGVVAVQRTGEPGRDAASFWVRGISTLGSTNPLVFLDGIEISISDLNRIDPVNIENFSILKDASATALYGARGANGVILVETKRGTSVGKPSITAQLEGSMVSPTQIPQFADGITFMELYNEARHNRDPLALPKFTDEKIQGTRDGANALVFPNVNWMDALFKDVASRQHANVNIRGGINRIKYYMGASLYSDQGILKKTDLSDFDNNIKNNRYNFVNNITVEASKTTDVELNLTADVVDYNGPAVNAADIFANVINSNPARFPIIWPNTDPLITGPQFGNITGGFNAGGTFPNPYADLVKGYKERSESMLIATLRINQNLEFITPGLTFNGFVSFKNWSSSETTRQYEPSFYQLQNYALNPETGQYDYTIALMGEGGTDAISQSAANDGDRTQFYQGSLNYNRTFGGKHDVGGLLVYYQKQYNINILGTSIISSLPYRNMGFAGKATYAYDGKYMAEFNVGYSGSETFAPGNRMGFFPAIALGYNISNEPFFTPFKSVVSNLKLRGSYGISGNDVIMQGSTRVRFPYLSDVNLSDGNRSYTFGQNFNNTRNGVTINRFPNEAVTWEIGKKLNVGADLELFKQLTLNMDFFRERREKIFLQREQVPGTLGIGEANPYANLGVVENKGIDFTLTYNKQVNKDLFVSGRGVFTFAKNKILERDEPTRLYTYQQQTGLPVNQIFGLVAEQLFADEEEIANSARQTYTDAYNPGDIRYRDVNSDGVIDDNDRVPMGYPTVPEITYGFGINVKYKKWDLGLLFQGIGRVSMMISNIQPFAQYERNMLQAIADSHWSETNPDLFAFYPRLSDNENPNNQQGSTWWLRDGDFLRLKTAELGFSVNKHFRVYTNGLNLLTFSKFDLWDPEQGGGNGLGYPPQRTINIGLQLNL